MKKVFYPLACCCLAAGVFASCGGQKKANAQEEPSKVALSYSKSLKAPETDSLNLPVDENGYITIFDGETFNGWRGYGKDRVPTKWTIEDGCIKFNGSGGGEAQDGDGGDLIFAHKFKNFELELEWKVAKGSNSGILYLAQEVTSKDKDGNDVLEPIYISAPEYQILDNANHPDAKLGKDNNRQSASLYDLSLIHISEPTRLGMISYAVFCLKKKKKKNHTLVRSDTRLKKKTSQKQNKQNSHLEQYIDT